MIEDQVDISSVYLYPSNIHLGAEPAIVTTVLGSCISVCLFDTQKCIGGINHFMLPFWNGDGLASAKYGNVAMDRLIEGLERLGGNRKDFVAKVFGGAHLVEISMNIGLRNYDVAKQKLESTGIKIVAESVGGERGRKVLYNTKTGIVRMKYVHGNGNLKHKI